MSKNKFRVARRSVWYVMRTLLIIMAVTLLALGVFLTAMHASNMYILSTEGMQLRAKCILQEGSILELTEYFTQEFIDGDSPLHEKPYADFTVSDYNYSFSIEGLTVFPWGNTARMRVVERVSNISASLNDNAEDQGATLPEWPSRLYELQFSKVGQRWYISALNVLEENPQQAPKGTPDLSLLPAGGEG